MNDHANDLRPELEALTDRLWSLPRHRGYPVPWFVAWVDGVPEFRAADGRKWRQAIDDRLCWVCGQTLGRYLTFVLGPMCGINRTTAEPPCHRDCAQWSARNCPFLSRPEMVRREKDAPQGEMPGIALTHNPGVTLLWTTRQYGLFRDGLGGTLIRIGDPTADGIEWWHRGKPATRDQVCAAIDLGLPKLRAIARGESPEAMANLDKALARFLPLVPRRLLQQQEAL